MSIGHALEWQLSFVKTTSPTMRWNLELFSMSLHGYGKFVCAHMFNFVSVCR